MLGHGLLCRGLQRHHFVDGASLLLDVVRGIKLGALGAVCWWCWYNFLHVDLPPPIFGQQNIYIYIYIYIYI